ncbi:unnamed protein product [Prorocentrum cordatum]|uniref:Uncharacterized protein n=1 Tax=Prorocentrum cordatum TaxID=2364126 RepID=A0ABN9RRB5_9DINO|nr:unnamed protein product [Polarella glacialis]
MAWACDGTPMAAAPRGGAPRGAALPRGALVALALGVPRASAARKYWEFDPSQPHRVALSQCSAGFSCPAGQRPVQQPEASHRAWSWSGCAPGAPLERGVDAQSGVVVPTPEICCRIKFVCASTCGMTFAQCFSRYWECVERECPKLGKAAGSKQEREEVVQACVSGATRHDLSQLPATRGAFEDDSKPTLSGLDEQRIVETESSDWERVSDLEHGHDVMRLSREKAHKLGKAPRDKSHRHCADFDLLQRQACDCVPAGEWDVRLQVRLEDFLRQYEPSMLNKRGKLKNKRVWKDYKGKRPEMFFRLFMDFSAKGAVAVRNFTARSSPSRGRAGHVGDEL